MPNWNLAFFDDAAQFYVVNGAPTWPPAYSNDIVTNGWETRYIQATNSRLISQNDTSAPVGSGGGYYYQWNTIRFDPTNSGSYDGPGPFSGTLTSATFHVPLNDSSGQTIGNDNPSLNIYFTTTAWVDVPNGTPCDPADWNPTASGWTLIGSLANPFTVSGSQIFDIPLDVGPLNANPSGPWIFHFLLDPGVTPSADPTATSNVLFQGIPVYHSITLSETVPVTTPPVQEGLTASGTSDCQARFLPELAQCIDAELQRRRWPSRQLVCEVPKSVWQTTREGDVIEGFLTSVGLKPRWATYRVGKRTFSERDGRYLIDLQHLDIPDGRGRRFQAARTLNTYNPRILDDMAGAVLSQAQKIEYLLMRKGTSG